MKLYEVVKLPIIYKKIHSVQYQKRYKANVTIYDTVYLRALKNWHDGQLNLEHGIETIK